MDLADYILANDWKPENEGNEPSQKTILKNDAPLFQEKLRALEAELIKEEMRAKRFGEKG